MTAGGDREDADYEAAVETLRALQQATYARLHIDPRARIRRQVTPDMKARLFKMFNELYPSLTMEAFEAFLKGDRAQSVMNVLTEYEDTVLFGMMRRLSLAIEAQLERTGLTLATPPLFGTLPSGRVNGMAIAPQGCRRRIIVFKAGLFTFANLVAKAVAAAFPVSRDAAGGIHFSTDLRKVAEQLQSVEDTFIRFGDVVLAYALEGNPSRAPAYLPAPERLPLISTIVSGMETFALAHEYGHCLAGHLDGERETRELAILPSAGRIVTDWRQEFEADAHGLHLTIGVMREWRHDLALSLLGIDLFFACVAIVYEAVSILRTGRRQTEEELAARTHPPPRMRRERLHGLLADVLGAEEGGRALALSAIMDRVVEAYSDGLEPVLQRMHGEGKRPAALWNELA